MEKTSESMTDFRKLCVELLCSLEQYPVQPPRDRDLIDRARTALAQPAPQGPTDEDLLKTAAQAVGYEHVPTDETCLALARAVLARWGCQ